MTSPARCALIALLLGLGACAKQSRDIPPALVDPTLFLGMSCSELVAERARRTTALVFAESTQDQTAADDRVRTLGLPTPMGTIFEGDRELEVARLKGEVRAATTQMRAMNCGPDYR